MVQRWRQDAQYLVTIAALAGGFPVLPSAAQLVQDNSLGAESSVITPNATVGGQPADLIEGGAQRGANLFHSFQEFNVGELQRVYFDNPGGVENILSRVTGSNPSNILGTLGSLGSANLFLINPNGIIFGPNATLDVGGSFLASTADSLQFANGFAFSASNPQAPSLLAVNVPLGLQYGSNVAGIRVQGAGSGQGGLAVSTGQTLALVGGEVLLEGGRLRAAGGHIELGSVAAGSLVSITPTNPGWELGYQGVQQFQDIRLTQAASVDTSGNGGGSIGVQGRRLTLIGGSEIVSVTQGTQAGKDITVRATELVEVIGFNPQNGLISGLAVQAIPSSTGNAGSLTIDTGLLRIAEGAQVSASTLSAGNGGDLAVRAQSVEVIGSNPQDGSSSLLSAQAVSTGNGGNLTITTDSLRIAEGARVSTTTFGAGKGGDLIVQSQSVEVIGSNPQDGFPSFLITGANSGSTGDAGSLTITTDSLRIAEGARVSTTTFGVGKGGDLTVQSQSVEVIGSDPQDGSPSILTAQASRGSTGNAGSLTIDTGLLRIAEGAQVSANTFSAGNGGDLTVRAQSVEVIGSNPQDGSSSFLSAQAVSTGNGGNLTITTGLLRIAEGAIATTTTFGAGKGGDLTVQSQSVEVIGSNPQDGFPSFLITGANLGSTGDAGSLTITTDSLRIAEGAIATTIAFSAGKGGDLTVQSQSVEVIGSDPQDGSPSFLATGANLGSTGDAGSLTITTDSLRIAEGARVSTTTSGAGKGGDLTVQSQSVEVIGSNPQDGSPSALDAQAGVGSTGNAGNIFLTTDRLIIANGGQLTTTSLETGDAGNITVQAASQIALTDDATINSDTNAGQGNITLNTPLLTMRRNSTITTNATGIATGGNITIDADFIVSAPDENNDIIANATQGSGGQIALTAQNIFWFDFRTREDLQRLLNTTNPDELTPRNLPSNDVTAFSQANPTVDTGAVLVQTPDLDPTQGVTTLPVDLSDPSQLIAATCPADRGSSFTITGRGGLPEDPRQPLMGQVIWQDERGVGSGRVEEQGSRGVRESGQANLATGAIVEVQGWTVDRTGAVVLVAQQPQNYSLASLKQVTCALLPDSSP